VPKVREAGKSPGQLVHRPLHLVNNIGKFVCLIDLSQGEIEPVFFDIHSDFMHRFFSPLSR
jgi:hypothetical protein